MAIRALLFASVLLFSARLATAEFEGRRLLTEDDYHTDKTRRILATAFKCDDVFEITIDEIQVLIFNKALTSLALVKCYVQRIADYSNPATYKNTKTPYPVNAIMELNPILYKAARQKDLDYAIKCKKATAPACLGPMHGIPVILKDNVAANYMQNTAGSLALLGCSHVQSTIAKKLAKRGAIILAKAGMSEWANYRGLSVSGWSGRIGQVACPYVHYVLRNVTVLPSPYPSIPSIIAPGNYTNVLNPTIVSGSSSGSAAAAATSLGTITVGSETSGSILSPSSANGLVGLKPTVGLISRFGVVPLSHSQDTAGPMGRTVTDVAYLLSALAGVDGGDEDTVTQQQVPSSQVGHYENFLDSSVFEGKTFAALALNPITTDAKVLAAYNASIAAIVALGAAVDVYPISPFFNITSVLNTTLIFQTDFKQDIAAYMAGCTWQKGYTPMYTLADLITFNKVNYLKEFQGGAFANLHGTPNPAYGNFFQQTWEFSQKTVNLYDPAYLTQKLSAAMLNSAITAFFTGSNPYSHTYTAFIHAGSFTGPWATTRNPSITVPMTITSLGLPQGIYFSGLAYSEQTLISLGYAFEQKVSIGKRPLPTFCDSYTC